MADVEPDSIPTPDPTVLTTDALRREIKASTDLTNAKLDTLADAHEAEKVHTAQINALRDEFAKEKSKAIESQFALRDTATDKLAAAGKTEVAAALQAQKEAAARDVESITAAITKSEAGFTKQIDGIGALVASNSKSIDDKFVDLKQRLDRGDGRTNGVDYQRTDTRSNVGMIIGILGAVFGFLMLAVAVIAVILRGGGQ